MKYIAYADGACSNNGRRDAGVSGSFAVYIAPDAENADEKGVNHAYFLEAEPLYFARRMALVAPEGARPTNNVAEALTLHATIAWLCESGALQKGNLVTIFMDSQIVLCQMSGLYRVKNRNMLGIYRRIHALLDRQAKKAGCKMEEILRFDWIPSDLMKATIIAH